jgi:hypothetical protein
MSLANTTLDPVMDRRIREELDRRVKNGAIDAALASRLTAELDRRSTQRPNPADTAMQSLRNMNAPRPSTPAPVSPSTPAGGGFMPGSTVDMNGLQMTPQLLRNTDTGSAIERQVQDAGRGFVRALPSTAAAFAGAGEAVESAVAPTGGRPGLFRDMRQQLLDPALTAIPPTQEFSGGLVESLPGVAAAYASGPFAPLVAAAQAGGQTFDQARDRMERMGATYDQASQIARAEAAPVAGFSFATTIPVFAALQQRGVPAETAKNWIIKAVPQPVRDFAARLGVPLGEAGQEASEEAMQMAMQAWAEADPQAFDGWQQRILQAGLAGGMIGMGAGALQANPSEPGKPQSFGRKVAQAFGQVGPDAEPMAPETSSTTTAAGPAPAAAPAQPIPGNTPPVGADPAATFSDAAEELNRGPLPRANEADPGVPTSSTTTTTPAEDAFKAVEDLRNALARVLGTEPPAAEAAGEPAQAAASPAPEAAAEKTAAAPPARTFRQPQPASREGASPNVARPDLGSGRLNIPMDVVPQEQRRAEAMRRAGVRDATNRILNPPQRGYSTEGSLTPEEVFPAETAGTDRYSLTRPQAEERQGRSPEETPSQPRAQSPRAGMSDPTRTGLEEVRSSPDPTAEPARAKEPWEMTRKEAEAWDSNPPPINNDSEGPWKGEIPPVGTYRVEKYTGVVQQLVEVDPKELAISEEEGPGRAHSSFPAYVQWAKEGKLPPPVNVVWNQPTKRWMSTNRRRVLAARDAGLQKILAWRDATNDDGTPVKHSDAVRNAIAEGKTVPPEVLADYPDLQAGRVGPPPGDAAEPKKPAQPKAEDDWSDLDFLTAAKQPESTDSTERERAAEEIRAAFGEDGKAVLPIMDAYARSWASATGKSTDDFYGRFSFEKGGSDAGSLKQQDAGPFFSQAAKAVRGFKDPKAKMTGAQWNKWLQNAPGIKPEELEWLGMDQAPGKMTPAEAAEWIDAHGVKVEEVTLGDPPPARSLPPGYKVVRGQGRQWVMERPDGGGEVLRILDVSASEEEATQTAVDRLVRSGVMEKPEERRTKFENYQTSGGKNYRELLLTMPEQDDYGTAWKNWATANGMENAPFHESERAFQAATGRTAVDRETFRSGHFSQPNILAHVRFNERTDADGKKVLFLEEIQSDWHQKGKKVGYNVKQEGRLPDGWKLERMTAEDAFNYGMKPNDWVVLDDSGMDVLTIPGDVDEAGARVKALEAAVDSGVNMEDLGGENRSGVPDAPFKTSWPMLAMKRMMVYAAQNGFDRIAWTTGEMQAERYDLSKQVDKVRVLKYPDGEYDLEAYKDGRRVIEQGAKNEAELEELIGKDLARKIVEDTATEQQGESPERLEAWAKVTEARQTVLEAERQVFGKNAFTVHQTNSPRGNWVVRRDGDDVSHHDTKEQAEDPLADYTAGFRRYNKDSVGREAYQPFEDAVENYRRVYAREWWEREERGEYPPGHPKALQNVENWKTYSGLDLKVGGEGMKGFYDQILPAETNKIAKKWGGRVGTTEIADGGKLDGRKIQQLRELAAVAHEILPESFAADYEEITGRPIVFSKIERLAAQTKDTATREWAVDQFVNSEKRSLKSKAPIVHSLDVTPAMREAVAGGMPLFQGTPQDARGSYRMLEDGRVVIRALTNPNASTLPHEVAHAFLDFLEEVDPKLKQQANEALGAKPNQRPTVEHHEKWARGFEAYLRTGKAPSAILRDAFELFKTWLRNIYQTIKGSPLEGKMNPGLKKVFDEMLTRGDSGKRSTRPSPAKPSPPGAWSKADLERRIRSAYDRSPDAEIESASFASEVSRGTQETVSIGSFKGPIPTDVIETLQGAGRSDLIRKLSGNTGSSASVGEDIFSEMTSRRGGVDAWIAALDYGSTKPVQAMADRIRETGGDPEAQLLVDLWENPPEGKPTPKDTIELTTGDELPVGSRFTIDGRTATVVSRQGEPTLKIKGLGEYPLVALREIPADRGSVEMFQRDPGQTVPAPTTAKIVDLATYVALRAARASGKYAKIAEKNVRSALDTFTGHGKYSEMEVKQVARMATSLLRRSRNKFGTIDPGRLEANTASAYDRVQRAERRAGKPGRLSDALATAAGVRPAPTTQEAVDRAVALERGQGAIGRAMEVRAAERAGEEKAARLKARLSEQGRKARDEMAQERRQMRDRLIGSIEALKFRALKEGYLKAQQAGEEGAKETTKRLQAFRDEAATIILKNLPRGERGRATLVRALRTAQSAKDIQRLITEVQHRAVSSRAGLAWKELRRATKGNKVKSLPEAAKEIQGIEEGKNVRAHVRGLLDEAAQKIRIARNQKAAPMKVARLLALRQQWMPIFRNPATKPEAKARAREILTQVREQLKDTRPDLEPKVLAAARLKEIHAEVQAILHAVKHADAVWLSGQRKSARGQRQFIVGRIKDTKQLARMGVESKPGLAEDPQQSFVRQAVFSSMTPDTFGQWLDNAAGFPEKAGFSRLLLFELPLDAAAAVAQEKVQRLERLNTLATKHGFKSFDDARARISGTLGPGLQETVKIDVDGWGPTTLTMGEALKIMGDAQDVQTAELSDMGMRHELDRLRTKGETTLDPADRKKIIDAIPKRFREFYTELKKLKDEAIGGRALEIRRRMKGSAPDRVEGREPRLRKTDSDYATDIFERKEATRSSLLERSFMKDRTHNPGPTNVIIDGLENHLRDWDDQLHTIHHAELANAIAKTLLHPDVEKAIVRKVGQEAWRRLQTTVDRILGVEIRPRPNAVDQVVQVLKKNTGAGLTAISPRTFIKQFSVIPLLVSMHPKHAAKAARGLFQKGLRERMMASNGLIAQRFSMSDAAIVASKGTANPVLDMGDVGLKLQAAKKDAADAITQLATGNIRNAARNLASALGNARDATVNSLRANGWADEQGVKLAFLIAEQEVDEDHPSLNKADREMLIGRKTAQMVHRYLNTYDTLGQAFWRGDLDASRAGSLLNMFSNDSTKQQNLVLQAAWSGDKGLRLRTAAGITLAKAYSVLAPGVTVATGAALLAAALGSSDDEEERRKKFLNEISGNALQELLGLTPGVGGEIVRSAGQMALKGVGGVEVAGSPAIDVLTGTIENAVKLIRNTVRRLEPADPEATPLQQYRKQVEAAEQQWKNLSGMARTGGTLAGLGIMPTVNFLRAMAPAKEPIGLAANLLKDGNGKEAAQVVREELVRMVEFGIPEKIARASLVERITAKLTKNVPEDDKEARREWERAVKDLVRDASNP